MTLCISLYNEQTGEDFGLIQLPISDVDYIPSLFRYVCAQCSIIFSPLSCEIYIIPDTFSRVSAAAAKFIIEKNRALLFGRFRQYVSSHLFKSQKL